MELLSWTKNSNTDCTAARTHRHKALLLSMWLGVLFLLRLNTTLTGLWASIGVTCSYSSHPFLCTLEYTNWYNYAHTRNSSVDNYSSALYFSAMVHLPVNESLVHQCMLHVDPLVWLLHAFLGHWSYEKKVHHELCMLRILYLLLHTLRLTLTCNFILLNIF